MLALLALQKNEAEQAASLAAAAVDLADQGNSPEARARARVALGQVKQAEREFKPATELLREAAELAGRARGSVEAARLELEAIIYLAEAYHNVDTRAGRTELIRAGEILNTLEDGWLSEEFNRVSAKYEEQIVFTEDNRLVFDGNQLPRWQEAKRTLEGFLLRNALRQTNNSLTRAARKLGVSKVHVHNLKKKHSL
jgi:tetratricopeptide (TPR) repeat protein